MLITSLSCWFGIPCSVLSCFKSYLSSRSFRIKCDNNVSSFYTSSCGVPQGSVLGPLLFDMYTNPLSTLISSRSLDHHFMQMTLSSSLSARSTLTQAFLALETLFSRSLPGWLQILVLMFNSSKTEFLLKNQYAKIHNFSLDTSHSARNLGFIFDKHFTFADQITSLSKACYYHIRQLCCIRPYLVSSTTCTTATSIVHSKLDYCNSPYYKLPQSQFSRL